MPQVVKPENLGPEFNQGGDIPGKITINLGNGLSRAPNGDLEADLSNFTLNVTKQDLFEYRDIWAEESGGTNANNAEWSFGNGATGFMGLPIDAGWEVTDMYFHADVYAATATIQVDLMDYGSAPSNAAANTIASIALANATDGGGVTNNAFKVETFAAPLSVPAGVVGFITRGETGNISDARVGARLRRKVGEYVSDVSLV